MQFYDTHAHLDYPDFAEDLPAIVERAEAAGITKIITIGVNHASSLRAVELSERFPQVYAVVGWHPSEAADAPSEIGPLFRDLARHPKVVAIGESGLDYTHLPGPADGSEATELKEKQERLFREHLELAAEAGLNCVVHQREAFEPALRVMAEYRGRVRGVFHCFTNDAAAMRRIVEIGSLVSFTGILTFKNAATVRECLAATPMGQFMFETDAPYLAPVPHRGKRCEPAYVRHVAEVGAQVKGCSMEELSAATCRTAEEFFPKLASS